MFAAMTGAGRPTGKLIPRIPPAGLARVASAPRPPPENVSPDGVAAGLHEPDGSRCRFAFTGVHLPCSFTRTGSTWVVVVRVPSGLATVRDTSVVAVLTVTGWPAAFASVTAAKSGLPWAGAVVLAWVGMVREVVAWAEPAVSPVPQGDPGENRHRQPRSGTG